MMRTREPAGAEIEIRPYRLRLLHPLRTSRGLLQEREGFVVLARAGGLTGRGEAAIAPELGTESLAEAFEQLHRAEPETPAARHAMELARLDLQAQRERVPLARLLAREALRAAADGLRTVKLKVGFDDDFARAAVVRDAVGPGVRLRLDANGAWSLAQAVRKLQELAPLDVEMCEQPTADLHELLAQAAVPIAADRKSVV